MKIFVISLFSLLLIYAALTYAASSSKSYQPTERIPADTAVSFPVDI